MHLRSFAAVAAVTVIAWTAVVVAPMGASAAIVTVPGGLSPGDQYRLAFVTSSFTTASSTSIAVYNAFVTTAANTQGALVALGTTWTAIGSTSIDDARDNTGTNKNISTGVPVYLLNGTKIADDNADLWDGTLHLPFNIFEDGNTVTGATSNLLVWTGTDNDGTAFGTSRLGDGSPILGITSSVSFWMVYGDATATNSRHVYAISDPLTVVPLPAALPLFLTALAGLGVFARRRRRKEADA